MNKRLLIKNICGEASRQEQEIIYDWIEKHELNRRYYTKLYNSMVASGLAAQSSQAITREEMDSIYASIRHGSKIKGRRHIYLGILKYAAALIILASLSLNLYQYLDKNKKEEILTADTIFSAADVTYTFYTEKGVKGRIMLPDSSVVWLNSGSKVKYPEQFDSKSRKLQFSGEGFFEVVKNQDWPMEILTSKGTMVKVLGTTFHLRSYDDDDDEQATLFTGRINITKKVNSTKGDDIYQTVELKPNESIVFSKKRRQEQVESADTSKSVAWKRGELLFNKTPLSDVFKKLERWHGMKIIVNDPSVLNYTFTASFGSESMVQIMELLKFTTLVDYKIVDNTVYVSKREIRTISI
ncbi:MAG: DUF4974 domain-containing protein [Bacteroidales bacterium]|nr:DUF4974 domain-containing protein [Bacteroidales bacterium]MDD4670396.1 DUF4974 domain-containing protein [Bacteroidales bacterium]